MILLSVILRACNIFEIYINLFLQQKIQNLFEERIGNINTEDVQVLFNETYPVAHFFTHVDSNYKLNKYIDEHLDFIAPQTVNVGQIRIWKRKPTPKLIIKKFTGYYVPMLDSLKRLLLNQDVRFCVENPRHGGNILKSLLDGFYYKNHPFFRLHEKALGIILYSDEIVLTNPLGSYTANHKLGMFYWSLANVYPEFRSTLQNVNLLAIVNYQDLKKHDGMEKILKKFVNEVKILQTSGIDVMLNNEIKNFKGSLLLVAGDTPASAWLGSFKQSVSANKFCRRCTTDKEFWKLHFNESDFILRTMETHCQQVRIILDPTLSNRGKKFWSKFYGLNGKTPLMDIEDCDITKCLVQDPMHVLFECVLEVEIRIFLEYCVSKNCFNVAYLNQQIDNFEYGHLQKDKPSLILQEHLHKNLRQSVTQMVCLAYVLPFLIGDALESDDESDNDDLKERLLCHVQLTQIMNMCLAFSFTVDDAHFLNKLIEAFIHKFNSLYPNSMVPKFHFLLHFGMQIIDFGPLRQQWCMRFEAVNAWFKTSAKILRNYKNMPSLWHINMRHSNLFYYRNQQ